MAPSARTRPVTADERDTLAAARLLALEWMPYLATALFETTPVVSVGLGTVGVDRHWRLYLDPDVLDRWTVQELAGVLLHEVGHLLRDHHARATDQGSVDPLRWNLAADAEINDDLLTAGIPLPAEPITPVWLGQPDGLLAESYLDAVGERAGRPEDPGFGRRVPADPRHESGTPEDPRCGSGAGGRPLDVELDPDDRDHPARSDLDQDLIRRRVAHDIGHAAGDGTSAGSVPGGWTRWAARQLDPPTIDWRRQLARAVRRGLAVRAGRLDTSYRRPGRRRIANVVTPGMVQPALRVGVVLDTSASMSDGQLRTALAELDAICVRAGIGVDDRIVVTADAAVHEVPRLWRAADLPITGGGGTDLRPAIGHLATHRRRPHLIVVLTDGATPWPDAPLPHQGVIAVLIPGVGAAAPPRPPPGWVQTIEVDPPSADATTGDRSA